MINLQYVLERLETISGDIACDMYENPWEVQTCINQLIQEIKKKGGNES